MFGLIAFVIVATGVVLLSGFLLARDSKRRAGRVPYGWIIFGIIFAALFRDLRCYIIEGHSYHGTIAFLKTASFGEITTFTGWYLCEYTLFLVVAWFRVLRPKKLTDTLMMEGVAVLTKGATEEALTLFRRALDAANRRGEKGPILCNMAICHLRLGQSEVAIKSLTEAVNILPSLKRKIAKDKDFAALQNDSQFRVLIA